MQDLFDNGEGIDSGLRVHAAVRFFKPTLGKAGSGTLPRSLRALKGWRNAAPPLQRMPLPLEAFGTILGVLLWNGLNEMVIRLFLQLLTYMRPGEASGLQTRQLVVPRHGMLRPLRFFAILLHPSDAEEKVPRKTSFFDQGIVVDTDLLDQRPPGAAGQEALPLGELVVPQPRRVAHSLSRCSKKPWSGNDWSDFLLNPARGRHLRYDQLPARLKRSQAARAVEHRRIAPQASEQAEQGRPQSAGLRPGDHFPPSRPSERPSASPKCANSEWCSSVTKRIIKQARAKRS